MTATVVRPADPQRTHASGTCYSLSCACSLRDRRRPIARSRAYAYLREHLLMGVAEVNRTKERMVQFAADTGLELVGTFVEEDPRRPAAFERLFQAVVSDEIEIVILPSLLHMMVLGSPMHIKDYFEAATGAQVVTVPG